MTEHGSKTNRTMWMQLKDHLQQLDQMIEKFIQQTVDDWEKTYHKEMERES